MPTHYSRIFEFWKELKRRKVVRVITVYAAAAFVILELVDIIAEPLKLPDWTLSFIIVLLCIGFIIAVILSWIYDVHPEGGIVKTEPAQKVKKDENPTGSNSWKIASYISFVVIVGMVLLNVMSNNQMTRNIQKLEKTIAVLPFEIWNSDAEFRYYLGEAIANEISTQLAKINDFHVYSYTSSSKFKGTNKPSIPQIGKELGANFIIEGTVERQNEDVSIHVQVIQAKTDSHIWAHEFKGKWEDIFTIRAEIAIRIAEELKTVLSTEEVESIEIVPTENTEAYNLYLQGRHLWIQEGKDNLDRSIEYYKRALDLDPNYALAYAGMAITYNSYGWYQYLPNRDVIPQAKIAAMKALEIDNTLGEAHTELAYALLLLDWDWSGSEKGFKRALELKPTYARAHNLYAWLLTFVGRHVEAIEHSKRAHELDPLSVLNWGNIGRRYYYAREYDRAIEEYRKILDLYPNNKYSSVSWYARAYLALALFQKGLYNKAIEEYSITEYEPSWYCYLGYTYGAIGKREQSLEILNHYIELSKKESVWNGCIAIIYLGLGEKDKALTQLDKAYEQREGWMTFLKVDPMFDSLRSDPRFQDLLERMNFPDNLLIY